MHLRRLYLRRRIKYYLDLLLLGHFSTKFRYFYRTSHVVISVAEFVHDEAYEQKEDGDEEQEENKKAGGGGSESGARELSGGGGVWCVG